MINLTSVGAALVCLFVCILSAGLCSSYLTIRSFGKYIIMSVNEDFLNGYEYQLWFHIGNIPRKFTLVSAKYFKVCFLEHSVHFDGDCVRSVVWRAIISRQWRRLLLNANDIDCSAKCVIGPIHFLIAAFVTVTLALPLNIYD